MVICKKCHSKAVVIIEKYKDEFCIHCLNCDTVGWIGRLEKRKTKKEVEYGCCKRLHD